MRVPTILLAHATVLLSATQNAAAQTSTTASSSCSSTIAPQHAQPSVAPGWQVHVVASGLRDPRGLIFDSEGGLLVVEQGRGVSRLRMTGDEGACVRADGEVQRVIEDEAVSGLFFVSSFVPWFFFFLVRFRGGGWICC